MDYQISFHTPRYLLLFTKSSSLSSCSLTVTAILLPDFGSVLGSDLVLSRSSMVSALSTSYFPGLERNDNVCVATTFDDNTLRLWKLDASEPQNHPTSVSAFQILHGLFWFVGLVYQIVED